MVNDFLKTVNKVNEMSPEQHGGIFKADFQPVANPKTILLGDVSCGFAAWRTQVLSRLARTQVLSRLARTQVLSRLARNYEIGRASCRERV